MSAIDQSFFFKKKGTSSTRGELSLEKGQCEYVGDTLDAINALQMTHVAMIKYSIINSLGK